MEKNEKLLLRPSEAAEALGLGKSKTYQLINDGTLPSVRIGKSVRIPNAALKKWIESQIQAQQANA